MYTLVTIHSSGTKLRRMCLKNLFNDSHILTRRFCNRAGTYFIDEGG